MKKYEKVILCILWLVCIVGVLLYWLPRMSEFDQAVLAGVLGACGAIGAYCMEHKEVGEDE